MLETVPNIILGRASMPTTDTFLGTTISTSNSGIAGVFKCSKSGNISQIGFRVPTITGTPPTYRIAIEGVNSSRTPDNTPVAYVDTNSFSVGWNIVTLGTPLAVTKGDLHSLTVRYQSGTVDASNNINVSRVLTHAPTSGLPFSVSMTTGIWTAAAGPPVITAIYDDGTYNSGVPLSGATNLTLSSASSPLYYGNKFTAPFNATVSGMFLCAQLGTGAFDLELFENDTLIATHSVETNSLLNSAVPSRVPFTASLIKGRVYRAMFHPDDTDALTTLISLTFPSSAAREAACPLMTGCYADTPPSWTDDSTLLLPLFPILSHIDSGNVRYG